jgi:hypothetical protein
LQGGVKAAVCEITADLLVVKKERDELACENKVM